MKFLDFEYDGLNLSDFGFIACRFNAPTDVQVLSAGSKISFSKISKDRGRHFTLVNTEYQECLTASFDICKNPDIYQSQQEMIITNDEYRDIMRWLNRREFLTFKIIPDLNDVDDDIDTCYFKVSCNVEKIKLREDLIGLRLTIETDKPFGYGEKVIKTLNFSASTESITLLDDSDEVGNFCPDTTVITLNEGGDLTLTNSTLGIETEIKNCTSGEVITLYGKEQIITSSDQAHDISNDFNYEFFRIGNTYFDRRNTITSNLACTVAVSYWPIIKDSI